MAGVKTAVLALGSTIALSGVVGLGLYAFFFAHALDPWSLAIGAGDVLIGTALILWALVRRLDDSS